MGRSRFAPHGKLVDVDGIASHLHCTGIGVLAMLSTNSNPRLLADSGHYIQHERPEAVVTAVRDVVIAVREHAPVRRAGP